MEKINIAELLKDCPRGMELDCTINDNVKFIKISSSSTYPIILRTKNGYEITLTKYGQVHNIEDSKCVIFPKGKTTWEGFVPPVEFKDGDILTTITGSIFIYEKINVYNYCGSYVALDVRNGFLPTYYSYLEDCCRTATEEEKQKLFQAIKANGYRWNKETKTLEKLPKFKIGDEIAKKNSISNSYIISSVSCEFYGLRLSNNTGVGVLRIDEQDDWELISRVKPIFKKGDKVRVKKGFPEPRIARIIEDVCDTFYTLVSFGKIDFTDQDNWELIPNKFDISNLKPFTKVLVRNFNNETWEINFFSRLLDNKHFKCLDASYVQCIPYKGNERLIGTINDCNKMYKTWEQD